MKILEYSKTKPLAEEITNPIVKLILKYGKQPNVTGIRNLNIRSRFEFSFISVDEFLKRLRNLIPVKVKRAPMFL